MHTIHHTYHVPSPPTYEKVHVPGPTVVKPVRKPGTMDWTAVLVVEISDFQPVN